MKNIKMVIAYDGSRFKGWQKQSGNQRTIQGVFERTLYKTLNKRIELYASGRTDAGVHSKGQVVSFIYDGTMPITKMKKVVNRALPADVSILSLEEVSKDFHARYSVVKKRYRYIIEIVNNKKVFGHQLSWQIDYPLNINKMKDASKLFLGKKDFSPIVVNNSKSKNSVREIYSINFQDDNERIIIDFIGDGFLYKMVRSIVGILVEVGRGKIANDHIIEVLSRTSDNSYKVVAPAKGLYLMEVYY